MLKLLIVLIYNARKDKVRELIDSMVVPPIEATSGIPGFCVRGRGVEINQLIRRIGAGIILTFHQYHTTDWRISQHLMLVTSGMILVG